MYLATRSPAVVHVYESKTWRVNFQGLTCKTEPTEKLLDKFEVIIVSAQQFSFFCFSTLNLG